MQLQKSRKNVNIANDILKYKCSTFEPTNDFIKQIEQANFSNDEDSNVKILGLSTLTQEINYVVNYLKSIDYTNNKY